MFETTQATQQPLSRRELAMLCENLAVSATTPEAAKALRDLAKTYRRKADRYLLARIGL